MLGKLSWRLFAISAGVTTHLMRNRMASSMKAKQALANPPARRNTGYANFFFEALVSGSDRRDGDCIRRLFASKQEAGSCTTRRRPNCVMIGLRLIACPSSASETSPICWVLVAQRPRACRKRRRCQSARPVQGKTRSFPRLAFMQLDAEVGK
jgi:hypothetical protein